MRPLSAASPLPPPPLTPLSLPAPPPTRLTLPGPLSPHSLSPLPPPPPTPLSLPGPLSPRCPGNSSGCSAAVRGGDSCRHMRRGRRARASFRTSGPAGLAPEQKASVTSSGTGRGAGGAFFRDGVSAQVPVPGAVPYGAGRGEQVYRSVPLSRAAPVSEGGPAAMWSAPAPTLRPHPTGHGLSPPLASPWQLQSEAQSSVLFIKLFGVEGDRGKRRMEEGKGGRRRGQRVGRGDAGTS